MTAMNLFAFNNELYEKMTQHFNSHNNTNYATEQLTELTF